MISQEIEKYSKKHVNSNMITEEEYDEILLLIKAEYDVYGSGFICTDTYSFDNFVKYCPTEVAKFRVVKSRTKNLRPKSRKFGNYVFKLTYKNPSPSLKVDWKESVYFIFTLEKL